MAKRYVFFDCETANGGLEYTMPRHQFVRLFQYAINDGPVELFEVHTPADLDFVKSVIESADYLVGHNILASDLSWIYEPDDLTPVHMALQDRVIDTFYMGQVVYPAPATYRDRHGKFRSLGPSQSPVAHAQSWLSLDNLAYQLGVPGKLGDLTELAKKYNPPKTKVADLDFSMIPLDDPEFRAYAEQDVVALRDVFKKLAGMVKTRGINRDYVWREMRLMALTVHQMSRNGILIDTDYANAKLEESATRKKELLDRLVADYDFPAEGKSPWSTTAGKEAILRVLADYGITPETRPDWPRTPTGALKMGGEDLIRLTEGTEAEEFARALAELKGQRTVVQQTMDYLQPDGRIHPQVDSLQRSGRWSITKPGVTVMGERNERLREDKKLFKAAPGKKLAGFDYKAADARAMAGLSGDPEFNRRFETDEDGNDLHDPHNLTGEAFFGADMYYGGGPRGKDARPLLRDVAKPGGHGMNYNLGAFKMAHMLNEACAKQGIEGLHFWAPKHENSKSPLPPIERQASSISTVDMINAFNNTYVYLKKFKDMAVEEAERNGYITNSWGRRMPVDKGREWTQAPALYGQSTTREVMGDAILKLAARGDYYIRALRAIIHDELLMEFDEETLERDIQVTKECMETVFDPGTLMGTPIPFPVGFGYGDTWHEAGH